MASVALILKESSQLLEKVSGQNAKREAKILLEFTLDLKGKILQLDHEISDDIYNYFKTLINKRLEFQPISQIIGERYFWKNKFIVSPNVLDPRPDTETLIEHTLSQGKFYNILDLGTGSGCIILSLLDEYKDAIGVGIDKSEDALNVAKQNANLLSLSQRVSFNLGNWCEGIKEKFDLIISNPPYISENDMKILSKSVLNWEPRMALTPEGDGLGAYRHILDGAKNLLIPNGKLILEIGYDQGKQVTHLLKNHGYKDIELVKDINNKDRVLSASWIE